MVKARADFDKGTLTVTEVNKTLKEVRNVYAEIREYKNKQMANDFGRNRLIFNYDENKMAEIIKYDSKTYLIDLANKHD